jgi:hypothetical protein
LGEATEKVDISAMLLGDLGCFGLRRGDLPLAFGVLLLGVLLLGVLLLGVLALAFLPFDPFFLNLPNLSLNRKELILPMGVLYFIYIK